MSPRELYIQRLKKMQATAQKIKPASKFLTRKILLSASPDKKLKREINCQF